MSELQGYGSTLSYANTDYSSPVAITKMVDFDAPDYEVETLSTYNYTTASQTDTFQAGKRKPGKAKCVINFDKTLIATIEGLIGTMKGWVITYTDGSTEKFNGLITKAGNKVPLDKLVTYEFEIQASGPKTWTPAA